MPQSLAQIYLHIIFSTKYRKSILDDIISLELYPYLAGICKSLDCPPINVGGYYDHIHILCKFSKKITLIKLLEETKRVSSIWIKTKGQKFADFHWQNGYAAFSVNPAHIDVVAKYITNQKKHHKEVTFQDECRAFFKKYKVDYDEQYVWD